MRVHIFLLVILLLLLTECSRTPSGPALPETTMPSVFCILDASISTQSLKLEQSLTFSESQNSYVLDTAVPQAKITLSDQNASFEAVEMASNARHMPDEFHHREDFLWGSGSFNYCFPDANINAGETYRISIKTNQFDILQSVTVPDTFSIKEVSSTFLDNFDHKLEDKEFKIAWSRSKGAAGYLLDMTILEYDNNQVWPQKNYPLPEGFGFSGFLQPPNDSMLVSIPFKEYPVHFSHANGIKARGILLQNTEYSTALSSLLEEANINDQNPNRFWSVFYIRINLYALDESAYRYAAFQFLNLSAQNGIVGQQTMLPDISNIKNGKGVMGAATSLSILKRFSDLRPMFIPFSDDPYEGDDVTPPEFEYYPSKPLTTADSVVSLSWSKIEGYDWSIVVVVPRYLWFHPGAFVFLTQDERINIPTHLFPLRNANIETYVRQLQFSDPPDDTVQAIIEIVNEKAALVMNGYYSSTSFSPDYTGEVLWNKWIESRANRITPWSQSVFIHTAGGELPGFEQQQPHADGTGIQWRPVHGADAYMVYVQNEAGGWAAAVTRETSMAPPFDTPIESIEGARTLPVASGEKLSWRVQALRVKTGGLGFAIEKKNGELPKVYPRYKHPSGIMLCSAWSEEQVYSFP